MIMMMLRRKGRRGLKTKLYLSLSLSVSLCLSFLARAWLSWSDLHKTLLVEFVVVVVVVVALWKGENPSSKGMSARERRRERKRKGEKESYLEREGERERERETTERGKTFFHSDFWVFFFFLCELDVTLLFFL